MRNRLELLTRSGVLAMEDMGDHVLLDAEHGRAYVVLRLDHGQAQELAEWLAPRPAPPPPGGQ